MSYPARAGVRLRRTATLLAAVMAMTLLIPAASALAEDYVALGDSYASGTGTRTYYDDGCERSIYAYNYLNRGLFGTFRSVACGGAKVPNVVSQTTALSAATKHVTVSVGGNDAGFSSVVTECALTQLPWNNDCGDANATARSYINRSTSTGLAAHLNQAYTAIRNRAPDAVVTVVGYPRLFNGNDCHALTFFSDDDMNQLNGTADILSARIRERARAHGFTYVDPRQAFEGHQVCDGTNEWINNLSNPTGESYHPNRAGHELGFAPMVSAAMQAAPEVDAPNGGVARIAFSSTRDGNREIYVVNANGQFPVRLTNDGAADIDPAWSPDGKKVAFASDRDGDNEIYVMNGDGTGVTKLTANSNNDQEPTWSPNGDYLAFRSDRTGNNEIFRMTATGGSQTNLTGNSASDFAPDWSPDGAEIAFQRFTSGSSTGQGNEVMKANASGQGHTNLTNNAASTNDGGPAWAPNGTQIAFHSNRDGDFEIFTMPPDGGTQTNRSANTVSDQHPAWSADNAQIAFTSSRTGNDEIFTMPWSGGTQTNRTSNSAADTGPSWQADSTPPTTTVTGGPNGPVADARPSFTFTSNEQGSTLQCRIDNGAYASCTSPYQPSANLSQGEHTFAVRATDPTGNLDTSPATRTFVVDTVAPVVTAECPPPVTLNGDAVATVAATDATSGMASIDDPSGQHELDTSVPGVQRFTTLAIDLAGNDASAECTYEVVYPNPGRPGLSDGASPNAGAFTLAWEPSAPAEYPIRYTLQRRDATGTEAADWQEVAAGLAEPRSAFTAGDAADEGTWTYRVRGIDTENDADTGWSTLSEPVVVDQTGPRAPKLSADRAPDYAGDGGWFADTVDVTTEHAGDPDLRDGSAPSGVDASSVADIATLTETATIRRTVRDRVGNESEETAETFQVDTDRPELELTCPDTVELLSDSTVQVAASDAGSGLAEDPSGTDPIDTDRAGRKTITRTATDNVGHTRTESCTVLVVYPTPGTPALSDGGSPNDGDFGLAWTASAPAGHPLIYQLERRDSADGAAWERVRGGLEDAAATFTAGERDDEGTWIYRVRGVDAGNELETPWSEASEPVVVDQTGPRAPKLTADRAPEYAGDGGWFADTVDVATTDAGDPALRDGSEPSGVDASSVADIATLTETATLRRTVLDRVGNESAESAERFQVDTDVPALELTCPGTVELLSDTTVDVAASDQGSGLAEDPSGTVTVDTDTVGTKTVRRTATDNVGHTRTESCDVLVVYPTPGAPAVTDGSNPSAGDFTLGWKASAPAGYPLRYVLERRDAAEGAEWQQVRDGLEPARFAFTAGDRADEGTWVYRVRGVDAENDVRTPWSEVSEAVTVDQTAPAAPSLTPGRDPEYAGDGGWWKDSVTVTTSDNGDPDLRDGSTPSGVDLDSIVAPRLLEESATLRRTVSDRVGNESDATERSYQVDTRRPALSIDCPTSVLLHGEGVVTVAASDDQSGLDRDPSQTFRIDTSEVGTQTFERTATDNVGHSRTVSCDVLVRYGYAGLLQPVNRDGSSIFKLGSTVPLKLDLTDADDRDVTGAVVKVEMEKITSSVDGERVEQTVTATPSNGKTFTYVDGHYQFNLSTKPLSVGTWRVLLSFDDGTEHRTRISLR